MEFNELTKLLSVSPQITPADVSEIAARGIKTILCNRPDGEAEDQPDYLSIQNAAQEAGISFIFQPVSPKTVTIQDVENFTSTVDGLQEPVLAYCRTGTRCTVLWALGESVKGVPVEQIISTAAGAGYDLSKQAEFIASAARR